MKKERVSDFCKVEGIFSESYPDSNGYYETNISRSCQTLNNKINAGFNKKLKELKKEGFENIKITDVYVSCEYDHFDDEVANVRPVLVILFRRDKTKKEIDDEKERERIENIRKRLQELERKKD